jgi:hypothetical protein
MSKIEVTNRDKLRFVCIQCDAEGKGAGMEVERDAHFLKACSVCGTETWCFLAGSSRLTVAEVLGGVEGSGREGEVSETIPVEVNVVDDVGGTVMETTIPVDVTVTADGTATVDTEKTQAEIERLKAELAKLEGE